MPAATEVRQIEAEVLRPEAAVIASKYIEAFGGYLAFRHGRVLRTSDRRIKKFPTAAAALDAAAKSKIQCGSRGWGRW